MRVRFMSVEFFKTNSRNSLRARFSLPARIRSEIPCTSLSWTGSGLNRFVIQAGTGIGAAGTRDTRAPRPITIRPQINNLPHSVLRLGLLIAEGLDRVDPRRLPRRIDAKYYAHCHRHSKSDPDR